MSPILLTLILLAALTAGLYFGVILARQRAFREMVDNSVEIRDDLSALVKRAYENGDLRSVTPAILERLGEGRKRVSATTATRGLLDRSGLSIRGSLGERVGGRLSAVRTALDTASGSSSTYLIEPWGEPSARQDLPYLLVMMSPAAVALMLGSIVGALLILGAAVGLWLALRLWSRRIETRGYRLWPLLDEITIYALTPSQERSQQKATLDLIDRLGAAFRDAGVVIEALQHAVRHTPDRVEQVVEAKMAEKAAISDALGVLGEQSKQMRAAIEQHAAAVTAIPENLSSSVSTEIRSGVEPTQTAIVELKDEIASSYGTMSSALESTAVQLQAVMCNLGDTQLYERWLDSMADSTRTVADLGTRLDSHFEDAAMTAKALHNVADVVGKTQAAITGELQELAQLNQLRGVDEKLFANKIYELFRTNLEKIEGEHRTFQEQVDEFIRKVEQDSVIREALRDEVPLLVTELGEVRASLGSLIDRAQGLPELYAEVVSQIQERAAANEKELYGILHGMSREFQTDYREFHQKVVTETAKLVTSLHAETDNAHRLTEERIAAQRASLQTLTGALADQATKLQELLTGNIDALDKRWKHFAEAQEQLHGRFVSTLRASSVQHAKASASTLSSIGSVLERLGGQAEHWNKIQEDVAETQRTLHATLAGSLTEAVDRGMIKIGDATAAHIEVLGQQTVQNQEQLAGLIGQVETQATVIGTLEKKLVETMDHLQKTPRVQMVQATCLGAIVVLLVLNLLGVGS